MKKNNIIISIITPSYNQGDFIEETIQSVLMQKGDFYIDYIIMDGGSKDQSVEIIKKYEDILRRDCCQKEIDGITYYVSYAHSDWNSCNGISYRWVSEKDSGQADAINKGIKKSFGKIIGWLNSDDVYYSDVFKQIAHQNFKKFDFFYGKGMWISKIGKNLLAYPTLEPSVYSFFYQCTLCQPAVFFSKKAVGDIGLLNNDYYCGFDFEYWMRALFCKKKFFYIDSFFAKSRMYMENKSLANQDKVSADVGIFKEKYYGKIKLNERKLRNFQYIHDETFSRVQKLNYKLKTGDKINLLFDATVIINDLKKDGGRSGIFFSAFNILKSLLNRNELNVHLFCYKNRLPSLKEVLNASFNGINVSIFTEDDFSDKEKFAEIKNLDIFFSPIFKVPLEIRKKNSMITYIMLYDTILMMFPEYFPVKQDWLEDMINDIDESDHFFAISENTKKDFMKYVPKINPKNIKVTHLAASDNFYNIKDNKQRIEIFKKYNLPINRNYIFSLCTLEPRKNLVMSIKCFVKFIEKHKIDDLVFILGGSHWDEFIGKLEKEINNFNKYREKIIRAGYICDEDLSILYSHSKFFVYPSLYEGFGLPVLEAMKCGTPVITSNNSSLPEVIGNAGIMVNPKSEKEIIRAFEKIYFNDGLRATFSNLGLKRAQLFSWEKTVDLMIQDMKEKIKNNTYEGEKELYKGYYFRKYVKEKQLLMKKVFTGVKFAILSPQKFAKKYISIILNSRLGQTARKIFYSIMIKKSN